MGEWKQCDTCQIINLIIVDYVATPGTLGARDTTALEICASSHDRCNNDTA